MKKKIVLSVFVAMVCVVFGTAMTLSAESATSTASVSLTSGNTDPVGPVNPENPDEPGTDTGTGMAGPLSLDVVPSITFGSAAITGRIVEVEAAELKPYMQVTDTRGTGAGWKVSVSVTPFTDGVTNSFDGTLLFKNGEVLTTTGNNAGAPTLNEVSITSSEAEKVLFTTTAADQGMGTWVGRWFPTSQTPTTNDSVTLKMNTSTLKAGNYSATLNWIISNAP